MWFKNEYELVFVLFPENKTLNDNISFWKLGVMSVVYRVKQKC